MYARESPTFICLKAGFSLRAYLSLYEIILPKGIILYPVFCSALRKGSYGHDRATYIFLNCIRNLSEYTSPIPES